MISGFGFACGFGCDDVCGLVVYLGLVAFAVGLVCYWMID